jgi:hypothetical protein
MHSSSTDYRENARLCLELAKRAANPEHAQILRKIAKAWLKLADERDCRFVARSLRPG